MKKKYLLFFVLILLFNACSYRYQVLSLQSEDVEEYNDDVYVYEEEKLAVSYDFWTEGGILLAKIYNHTDSTLFIDGRKSYQFIAGDTLPYFDEAYQLLRNETDLPNPFPEPILKIAPQSSETIEGYPISFKWTRWRGSEKQKTYQNDNSPIVFKNHFTYSFHPEFSKIEVIDNEFWIAEVENMKNKSFKTYDQLELQKSNKFYVSRNEGPQGSTWMWLDIALSVLEIILLF